MNRRINSAAQQPQEGRSVPLKTLRCLRVQLCDGARRRPETASKWPASRRISVVESSTWTKTTIPAIPKSRERFFTTGRIKKSPNLRIQGTRDLVKVVSSSPAQAGDTIGASADRSQACIELPQIQSMKLVQYRPPGRPNASLPPQTLDHPARVGALGLTPRTIRVTGSHTRTL